MTAHSEQRAAHIERARQNGMHIGSEPVTLPAGYACHHCGGTLAAATYTATSLEFAHSSATCAACGQIFVITFERF